MVSDERLGTLIKEMQIEERDCKHAQVPHFVESDLLSALTELRERRRVERAVEEKIKKGVYVELHYASNGVFLSINDEKFQHRLGTCFGETIHAALAALVGEEPAKEQSMLKTRST